MACFFANQWRGELVFALCTRLLVAKITSKSLYCVILLLDIFLYTDFNKKFQTHISVVVGTYNTKKH